jgi:hypothetical protein
MRFFKKTLLAVFCVTLFAPNIYAVRPFITDDAAITEYRHFQLETWAQFDRNSGQHWALLGYGLTERLELSIGGVWGYDRPNPNQTEFSFALPILQAKYLFREIKPNSFPGIAAVLGTSLPFGRGEFVPPGYGAYGFLVATQALGRDERVLIHGNIGLSYFRDRENGEDNFIPNWGLGVQARMFGGFHIIGEIFDGDPYIPEAGLVYQAGFRHYISDSLQLDATVGQGIGRGETPFWISFGARIVMPR